MDECRCMVLEDEVEELKKRNKELEEQIFQLIVKIKVLECEKLKAEGDNSSSNEKVKQLESQVCELESKFDMNQSNVVSPPKRATERLETGAKQENCNQVRKCSPFENDGCSNIKLAPCTPSFAPPPSCFINSISDEDASYNFIPKAEELSESSLKNNLECTSLEDIYEGDRDGFRSAKRKRSSNIILSDDEDDKNNYKRKGCSNIVTSDDETSYDDNAPISTVIKKYDVSKRPLKRLRKLDDSTFDLNKTGNSSSDQYEEDDESLDEFIDDSSESASVSEAESEAGSGDTDSCDQSEDGLNEYKATMDKIRRKKDLNLKWGSEGDMLPDFDKDPELCMRAVCALYRQQTADEREANGTFHKNGRGFSQTDAFRGSQLAEFLTDGDSDGDLKKTVEELKRYDTKGIEVCEALARKYSKQLFRIYENKEDQYFMP